MNEPSEPKPLSTGQIVGGSIALVVVAAIVGVLTWLVLWTGDVNHDLDAIKTAVTVIVAAGGALGLLLAARRQRFVELTFAQQRAIADATQRDAEERRNSDLYVKAGDQLGSDKAAVRLAGLYALERLGVSSTDQRPTVINLLCGYLRGPFEPANFDLSAEAPAELRRDFEERPREELVRWTAQQILWRHRQRRALPDDYWEMPSKISLVGAYLAAGEFPGVNFVGADLTGVRMDHAQLASAQLENAGLLGAALTGADLSASNLRRAHLVHAYLDQANLLNADLTWAKLEQAELTNADMRGATLVGANMIAARMTNTRLGGATWSDETTWPEPLLDQIREASERQGVNYKIKDHRSFTTSSG